MFFPLSRSSAKKAKKHSNLVEMFKFHKILLDIAILSEFNLTPTFFYLGLNYYYVLLKILLKFMGHFLQHKWLIYSNHISNHTFKFFQVFAYYPLWLSPCQNLLCRRQTVSGRCRCRYFMYRTHSYSLLCS